MGRLERRLEGLEEIDRESAAAEIRRALDRLSDGELALVLAPYYLGRNPTPEETEAKASLEAVVSEELIARAIGYRADLPDEEVSRRLGQVTDPVVRPRRRQLLGRITGQS